MEHVAPDMLDRYPYLEPAEFASGVIQNMADSKYCIDRMNRPKGEPIGKYIIDICTKFCNLNSLQACMCVPIITNVRKIINISHCDTIETFQRRTWKCAWIHTVKGRDEIS